MHRSKYFAAFPETVRPTAFNTQGGDSGSINVEGNPE
jgi:hypothetical protein